MFRIPFSPRLRNSRQRKKPLIFLQHGLLSSSDCWILNGPNNALAYLLSDAGYDVWLGNARGNMYSKKHAHILSSTPNFWNFSWHEIGVYDLPAMLNYALYISGETSLHYVGHSQGTTVFMVLLSQFPEYNLKIKTSHMLSPVAFMSHMQSPLAKAVGSLLGYPSKLSELFGSNEILPTNKFFALLGSNICRKTSPFHPQCGNLLFLIGGWNSLHLNYTLLPLVMETHPAGSSTSQIIHYLQEYKSGYFRQFDHGDKNMKYYKQKTPPEYKIENIHPAEPIQFYYSKNDYMAAVTDVLHMAKRLGKHVALYQVKYRDWNHLDFLWALKVKSVINDRILMIANKFEKKEKII